MPIITFSEAFPKRGRGRGRGREGGRGRGRGRMDTNSAGGPTQAAVPFHGAAHSLMGASEAPAAVDEGQVALASGVFAEAPARHPHTSYLNAVQSLQRKQDDAAQEALMERFAESLQQQRLREQQERQAAAEQRLQEAAQELQLREAQGCATSTQQQLYVAAQEAALSAHAAGHKESSGMQGQDHPASCQAKAVGGGATTTIDLCSSDEEQSPHAPAPKRRPPAVPAPAAASASGQPTRQPYMRGLSLQQGAAGTTAGHAQRCAQPDPPRLGIPESPKGNDLTKRGGAASSSCACGSDASWMFGGAGAYVPDPRAAKVDMKLRLHEIVDVFDLGLMPHHARAVLDSGNGGHTLITASCARRLGLLDAAGRPKQARQRMVTVTGVVANATERIPLMTLTYELRGKRMTVTAGVTEASLGCDILLSCREIAEFISDGFCFDIR